MLRWSTAALFLLLESVFLPLDAFPAPLSRAVGPKPRKGFRDSATGTGRYMAKSGRTLENK